MVDLLVIGAGLAGLCAALRAAQHGLSVRVVAKGMGALHWSAGTVDLLGYPPGQRDAVRSPLDELADLPVCHPYQRVGRDRISQALDWFKAEVSGVGLPYTGATAGADNLLLPSPVGAARPVFLAPDGQRSGCLARRSEDNRPADVGHATSVTAPVNQEPLASLIVGFHGLTDFYPAWIAQNLSAQSWPARAEQLSMDLITSRTGCNTVHLAEALESEESQRRLAEALRKIVRPSERIGLPAILGLDRHSQILSTLASRSGAAIFEIPTLPPSVPGIRLYRALRARLAEHGVRIETGMEAISFSADGRRIVSVATETSARPLNHRASAFLLATGGILGGGFGSDASGRVWETVFDLPLTTDQDRRSWFKPRFLDPGGHPVFQSGIRVDGEFRPIAADGERMFDNLWVAGGALDGADPIRERSLEGLAIATGWSAAGSLVQALDNPGRPEMSHGSRDLPNWRAKD